MITQLKKENPEASEAKSESSLKDTDQEEEEEQEEEPRLSQMSDYQIKGKLKPSGVVFSTHIDPDASSDDEKTASRMEASMMAKKIEATLESSAMDKMSKSALADMKAQKEKLLA